MSSTTTTTTNRPALIASEDLNTDILATFTATYVKASNLREGMLVLDEFDTPDLELDHKMPAVRDGRTSASVKWFAFDIEQGRYVQQSFRKNFMVKVAAK